LQAIRSFPVPVVAALNGDALGGGAELAVAADMRVFAAHARIGFIQGRLALTTAWGGSADLVRLVGPSCALRLTTRCETLDAVSAQTLGLADAAARDGQPLEDAVAAFLAPMLKQRREVLAGFKSLANAGRDAERARFDALETEWFASTWVHEDHWSAVDAIKARSAREERGAVARVREA
jgi:enoyl-CoA hydratase